MRFSPLYMLLLLLLSTPLRSFSQDFRGAIHVRQREFKEANDSLYLSFSVQIDSRALPTRRSMILEPVLTGEDSRQHVFPYLQVNGRMRGRLNRRWFAICSRKSLDAYVPPVTLVNTTRYTYEELTYSLQIPYESWMDNSELTLRQEVIGSAGELHLYTFTLGSRIATQPKDPYSVQAHFSVVTPDAERKVRNRQGSAFLDFQVGRSVILPDFRRNPAELGKIHDAMSEVVDDTDSQISGLFIEGYASPEGSYSSNERLAHDRSMALKEYLKSRYMLPDNLFTVKSVAEDWVGLRSRVEGSDLPGRDQLLGIIDSGNAPDTKEQQLKRTASYPRLLRDFFPELRRVEYQIDYVVRNYNTSEALSLWRNQPESLSQLELFGVAQTFGPGSAEYREILLDIIPRYYGDDAVALNNASALLLENGEYHTALRLLEKVKATPLVWNNLGVAYLLAGDLERAEELLGRASATGSAEAARNLEEVARKREDELQRAGRKTN